MSHQEPLVMASKGARVESWYGDCQTTAANLFRYPHPDLSVACKWLASRWH